MMTKRGVLWGLTLCIALVVGCQQSMQRPVSFQEKLPMLYDDICWISFSIQRPYIDEDNDGYPDGVMVDVMLNRPNEKAFVAGRGSVIFHLIQRQKNARGRFINKDLYTWKVSEEEFTRAIIRQRFGLICHHMALYWAGVQPQGPGLYLKAEFIRTDQKRIESGMVPLSIIE